MQRLFLTCTRWSTIRGTQQPNKTSALFMAPAVTTMAAIGAMLFTAPAISANNSSTTICTLPGHPTPRIVELIYDSPESPIPCRVLYTKDGTTTEEASAQNTKGYCEKAERKIVRTLVKADYTCEHSFEGVTIERDSSVVLNLFEPAARTRSTALDLNVDTVATTSVLPNDNRQAEHVRHTTAALEDSLAQSVRTQTNTALLEELKVALSEVYGDIDPDAIGLTVNVSVDVDITIDDTIIVSSQNTSADTLSTESPAESNSVALADTTSPTASATDEAPADTPPTDAVIAEGASNVLTDTPAFKPAEPGAVLTGTVIDYAIVSTPLPSENDAHRYASEVRYLYPNVVSRVSRSSANDNQWHVVLGQSNSETTLATALASLSPSLSKQFVIQTLNDPTSPTQLEYVPDDWARYAVASCYAQGHQTTTDLAECAGVVLDVDSFLSCVGGGVCAPELFSDTVKPEYIDLVAVIGSDDPVAAARQRLVSRVEGCERLDGTTDRDFAECAALSIMDDDQREVYDCYQRDNSTLGMLQCAGSDSVSDYAYLYERCTADNYMAAECLLDNLDNEYLSDASRCVHYGDTEAILGCALDSSLDIEESRALSCLQYSGSNTERAQCLARDYLSDTDSALLSCATETTDVASFGLCSAERNGDLTREEYLAAQCLLAGNTDSQSLLSCAGGRFASNDIGNCLINGIDDPACFDTETELNQLANNAMEDFISTNGLEKELALYRAGLFTDEGGDIPDILSNPLLLKVFAGTKAAAKAVTKTVTKQSKTVTEKTKSVFKRFGFGKN